MADFELEYQETENMELEFDETKEVVEKDYSKLSNKPKVNNVELNGNKSSADLGIITEQQVNAKDTATLNAAKSYSDGNLETAKDYAEEKANDAFNDAKDYTDEELEDYDNSNVVDQKIANEDTSVRNWADSKFLTEHQSLAAYRTSAAQDIIDNGIKSRLDVIEPKIPSQATSTNKLADKDFVNSSIATATSTFRGTFDSLTDLKKAYGDANDYAYLRVIEGGQVKQYDRYKYVAMPKGYKLCKYIWQAPNGTKITLPKPSSTDKIEIKLNINGVGREELYLTTGNANGDIKFYQNYLVNNKYYNISNGLSNFYFSDYYLKDIVINIEAKTDRYKVSLANGTLITNLYDSNVFSPTGELVIGGLNTNSTRIQGITYKDFYHNIIHEFIPAIDTKAGKGGLYDVVEQKFYTGTIGWSCYSTDNWQYEYTLNNSSFTAAQWSAINSGITQELVSQITTNQNNITSLDTNKVDKEQGKGLSTNDYTTEEKNKLSGIESNAQVNVKSNWNETDSTKDSYIQNKPNIYTQSEIDTLLGGKANDNVVVKHTQQSLTDMQKLQARTNIGTQKIWKGTTEPTPQIIEQMAEGDIYVVYED